MPEKRSWKDFLALAKARKTTYEFSGKAPPDKDVMKILEAGRWAPSCGNSQPWSFVMIRNPASIRKLADAATHGGFFAPPKILIAIVLRKGLCRDGACFRSMSSDAPDSYMGVGMAGIQMILQATDLGISSCILSPEPRTTTALLKVKGKDSVPLMLGFGYEKKGAYAKKRDRRALEDSLNYECIGGRK